MLGIKYDIIIAGAGPAGSTLAYLLARAGLEVLLLEKELLPRDKPCGGGLTHKSTRLLSFPWEQVVEDTVHKAVLNFRGRGGIEVNTSLPMAYMVSRSTFDNLLAAQAIQAGAHLLEKTAVEEITPEKERVMVRAGGVVYEGKIFAGADGIQGPSCRLLGLDSPRKGPALDVELLCTPEMMEQNRGVFRVEYGAAAWGVAWVFPKKDHLSAGIACYARKGKGLKQYLNDYLARQGLGEAKVLSVKGCLLPEGGGRKRIIQRQSVLLLGDAAGLVDPLSGEGIFYALQSAHLAAQAILEHKTNLNKTPAFYQSLVEKNITAGLAVAGRLAAIYFTFPNICYSLMEKHPAIAELMCRTLTGETSYADLKDSALRLARKVATIARQA